MANKKGLYIIIVVLAVIIIGGGAILLSGNNGAGEKTQEEPATETPAAESDENEMVDCGLAEDPMCFMTRMSGCLPVTTKMMATDNTTQIDLTILGVEDEKCHFQRKINNVVDLDCYFPKGTLNWDTIDQMFGNDKGLQQVVDDNCQVGGGW